MKVQVRIACIAFCAVSLSVLELSADAQSAGDTSKDRRPPSARFVSTDTDEVPDFQRHVVPLLGRLGCNGRSCHGSFQGRGDLRLSLFGYDFEMDDKALHADASSGGGKRVDPAAPESSLILKKPTLQLDHEGGKRIELGSWEYHLLQRWIEDGAKGTPQPRELSHLQIEPSEVVLEAPGTASPEPVALRVTAVWEDGQREDVTPLCRFRTNDDSVVTVDREGLLVGVGPGDTHVVAFYDNGVVAVPVMRPWDGTTNILRRICTSLGSTGGSWKS